MVFPQKQVILIETNLFFSAKIAGSLATSEYQLHVVCGFEEALQKVGVETVAIVLNLNAPKINVEATIVNLKTSPQTAPIFLIGFGGHQERGLFQSASRLGCDLVVANSVVATALVALLHKIESRHASP